MNSRFRSRTDRDQKEPLKESNISSDPIDVDLFINDHELNRELLDQPLRYAKWIKLKAKASRAMKAIKLRLKNKESEYRLKHSVKGMRVDDVAAKVSLEPEILKLSEELIETEELFDQYEGFVRAFHQRAEVLKDLCANRRKELID